MNLISYSWEQRKLGDITFQSGEKNTNDLPYESYSVSNKEGFINQKDQFKYGGLVSIADKSKSIIVSPHTFAYNPARIDIGSIGYQNLDKDVIISPMYEIFKADNSMLDDRFLWHWLKSDTFNLIVINNQEGGVRTCFNLPKFFNSCISIPKSIEEQREIGAIFDQLDNLITLHQRKLIFLKSHRFLMSVLFCYSWEQRKVKEIAERFDNLRIPVAASQRESGLIPYYGANGIQDYVDGYTHEGEFVLVAEDGANDLKNYPVQYVNGRIWVNNHAHVLQSNQNNDTKFLKYLIGSTNIENLLVGGGRAKLNAEVLMKIDLKLPKKQEQIKISTLFDSLDSLITLHQRKQVIKEDKKNVKKTTKRVIF